MSAIHQVLPLNLHRKPSALSSEYGKHCLPSKPCCWGTNYSSLWCRELSLDLNHNIGSQGPLCEWHLLLFLCFTRTYCWQIWSASSCPWCRKVKLSQLHLRLKNRRSLCSDWSHLGTNSAKSTSSRHISWTVAAHSDYYHQTTLAFHCRQSRSTTCSNRPLLLVSTVCTPCFW